jgi:inosine/xanthosine triphosphate pyrophosphatase family protein
MFLPDGQQRTFGEMSSEEKHGLPPRGLGLSHRARAFRKLAEACLSSPSPRSTEVGSRRDSGSGRS